MGFDTLTAGPFCPTYPIAPAVFHAPALLLQESAYSYRMWITLNKLFYAPLRHLKISPDIHQDERLCGRLIRPVLRVSEKNSYRILGECR